MISAQAITNHLGNITPTNGIHTLTTDIKAMYTDVVEKAEQHFKTETPRHFSVARYLQALDKQDAAYNTVEDFYNENKESIDEPEINEKHIKLYNAWERAENAVSRSPLVSVPHLYSIQDLLLNCGQTNFDYRKVRNNVIIEINGKLLTIAQPKKGVFHYYVEDNRFLNVSKALKKILGVCDWAL